MTWLENEAFLQMYERAGFMATDDGALIMLAGSTLGGGKGGRPPLLCACCTACKCNCVDTSPRTTGVGAYFLLSHCWSNAGTDITQQAWSSCAPNIRNRTRH
jgi:hypothetical protein